jgi:hypothetical protein
MIFLSFQETVQNCMKVKSNSENYTFENSDYFPCLAYAFPDEDLCLFRSFSHEKLVLIVLAYTLTVYNGMTERNLPSLPKCSCTVIFLGKHMDFFIQSKAFEENLKTMLDACEREWSSTSFKRIYDLCNLTQKLASCDYLLETSINTQAYADHYFDLYDIQSVLKSIKSIQVDNIGPAVSASSAIANLLVILTVSNANKKNTKLTTKEVEQLKQPFFTYMLINAVVNVLYCCTYFI